MSAISRLEVPDGGGAGRNEKDTNDPMDGDRPKWLPYAVALGSPCFAGAMTIGVFAADAYFAYFIQTATVTSGGVRDAVVCGNAFLAFLGASVGGAMMPGPSVRRAKTTAAAGVTGLVVYGSVLAAAVNVGGVMI